MIEQKKILLLYNGEMIPFADEVAVALKASIPYDEEVIHNLPQMLERLTSPLDGISLVITDLPFDGFCEIEGKLVSPYERDLADYGRRVGLFFTALIRQNNPQQIPIIVATHILVNEPTMQQIKSYGRIQIIQLPCSVPYLISFCQEMLA